MFVVYHALANKNHPHLENLLFSQLNSIKKTGFFDIVTEFHITLVSGAQYDEETLHRGKKAIRKADHGMVNITATNSSYYEYLGVHKAWTLQQSCIDLEKCLILYFHSKGAFNNYDANNVRTVDNILLTKLVVEDWKYIIDIFRNDSRVNTVGMSSGCDNAPLQFHNFWWTRGSYMALMSEPDKSESRHYYEYWLGTGLKKPFTDWSGAVSLCKYKYNIERDDPCPNDELRLSEKYACKCTDFFRIALVTGVQKP